MTKLFLSLFGLLLLFILMNTIYAENKSPKGRLSLIYQDVGITASVSFDCDWIVMAKGTMYWGTGRKPKTLDEVKQRAAGSRIQDWNWFIFEPFVWETNENRPGRKARAISL